MGLCASEGFQGSGFVPAGRFEFLQYFPGGVQGVALAPAGPRGCLVAAVDAVRGFSRLDQVGSPRRDPLTVPRPHCQCCGRHPPLQTRELDWARGVVNPAGIAATFSPKCWLCGCDAGGDEGRSFSRLGQGCSI